MAAYSEPLRQALILFPTICILFTVPYVAWNYHKYGSIFSPRILIVYSFILYLLCTYCLIILPLPSAEEAAKLHGRKTQLIPFSFAADIVKNTHIVLSQPKSWLTLLNNRAVLTNLFNVLMTMPFSMYLRYYFRCSRLKTVRLSFLLSLFFELTQLTGLYFIYPGSYRLFDVDDLIMNTLGGLAGYALAGPFLKFLPAREDLDRQSYARGESVSLLRRLAAVAFDFVFDTLLCSGIAIVAAGAGHSLSTTSIPLLLLAYFILLPGCTGGRTPGMMIASFKIAREDGGRAGFFRLLIRYFFLGAVSVALPLGLCLALFATPVHEQLSALTLLILVGALAAACLFFLLVCMIQAAMHKPLFYEKLSRTRVFSTVKKNK